MVSIPRFSHVKNTMEAFNFFVPINSGDPRRTPLKFGKI